MNATKLAQKIEVLTMEQLEELHEATLEVLENTGIEYNDDEALEIFKKHGAKVSGNCVYIPREMVNDSLRTVPKTYVHRGLDPNKSLEVGDPNTFIYGPNFGAAFVKDYDGTKRPSTLKDTIRGLKLAQSSKVINLSCMHWCEPQDIDIDIRHLVLAKETMMHTDKPIFSYNILNTKERTNDYLDLLEMGYGKLDENNHCIGFSVASSSPLRYETAAVKPLLEFAKRNQPLYTANSPIVGISGPIHLLGNCVVLNAECLATVVLAQLVQPGVPVVYGVSGVVPSFRTCKSAWGSPESQLMNMVNTQLAMDLYQIPTRIHGGDTTSQEIDFQSAVETMQNVMTSALNGVNVTYFCSGVLEDVNTISWEKFVLDEEIISRVDCIRQGMKFSKEDFCLDLIHEMGPGGLYLTHESTWAHSRDRWATTVSDWDYMEGTERDMLVKAHKIAEERIAAEPDMLIDPALEKDMQAFIDKKTK